MTGPRKRISIIIGGIRALVVDLLEESMGGMEV